MTPLISTSRLALRPHQPDDADFMVALNSDPLVVQYTGDVALKDAEEATLVIAALQRQFAERRLGRLVALDRVSGERLGWCGFKWHDDEQAVDLGFRFFRAKWNQGYATEASMACLHWLTEHTNIRRVIAYAMPVNLGSVRVLEKVGFEAIADAGQDGFQRFELAQLTPS